jgi:hypothetical protein
VNLNSIIAEIDALIDRLQKVKAILSDAAPQRKAGKPAKSPMAVVRPKKNRNLSPEGRARIAAAVKARWAKQKKG